MKLGVLGADHATIELARAAAAGTAHTLAWVAEVGGNSELELLLRSVARTARPIDEWESLLDEKLVDAVIVSATTDQDRRAEQLRKFVQVGRPVLVSHPVVDSMLVYYELDMIRRETGAIVLPYLPDRWHPAVVELARIARGSESSIGRVEQLVMERQLQDRSRRAVLAQFARDVDLVRAICGEVTRLGAMGAATEDPSFANLGVQMAGPEGMLARWSVGPVAGRQGARLTLLGPHGKIALEMPLDQPWTLEIRSGAEERRHEFPAWQPAELALDRLAAALAGESSAPDWVDAARSVELTETIERSLHKGRNIELYYEDYTEQGTFKGVMTSLGCGLLVAGLGVILVIALADNAARALRRPIPFVEYWPYFLTGLLASFLLLQLFSLLFAKEEPPESRPPES